MIFYFFGVCLQSRCNRNQTAEETLDKESSPNLQYSSSYHQPHVIPITHHHHHHLIQFPPNIIINDANHHITTTAADCSNNHNITAELEYVKQLLRRRTTPNSSSLYSSENYTHNNNISIPHRKLLCHLVEELLKPYAEIRPYRLPLAAAERWPDVVEKLCDKVKKLPRAKCEVLEDIDGIIEKDMDISGIGFEDQGDGIVKEIEKWIVEELLNETVRFFDEV